MRNVNIFALGPHSIKKTKFAKRDFEIKRILAKTL